MKKIFSILFYPFKWFFVAFTDLNRFGMALSRAMFTLFGFEALRIWDRGDDIKVYHFYTITGCLGYLFFNFKFLEVISKIVDAMVTIKTGQIPNKEDSTNG